MIALDWRGAANAYDSGIWRIRRVPDAAERPWRLEIAPAHPVPGAHAIPAATSHRTLRGARASALHFEMERIRTAHLHRYLAAAVVAGLGFVAVLPFAGGLLQYLTAVALAGVVVNQAARAVDVRFGSHWGRIYRHAEHVTRLDRVVALAIGRLSGPAARSRCAPRAITVLPPE